MKPGELGNDARVRMLAQAIWSTGRWQRPLQREMHWSRQLVWEASKGLREPTEEQVCQLIAHARAKQDEIERAINACKMWPWIK